MVDSGDTIYVTGTLGDAAAGLEPAAPRLPLDAFEQLASEAEVHPRMMSVGN